MVVREPPLNRAAQRRVMVPFGIVTLLWSSTWLVIRHQLHLAPASWSITYRFAIAGAAMFAWGLANGTRMRLSPRDHAFAATIGVFLFGVNFNFIYRAEAYVASGLVALVFALLVVPNAVFSRIFLNQPVSRRFVGGASIALAGLGVLFGAELMHSPAGPAAVLMGIAFTVGGVFAASLGNVMQATERARRLPAVSLLAWGMIYAAVADAAFAWVLNGPPVFPASGGYWFGVSYLALAASALAFPLYLGVIQAIGPGRAAYSSVLVPVLAMALSTLFEGYRWSVPAAIGVGLVLGGLLISLRSRVR